MSKDYESYDDWYDNGPGSENFKRKIRESSRKFYEDMEVVVFPGGGLGFRRKEKKDDSA